MSKYRMMQGWKGPHSHSAQYIPEELYDKKLADINREQLRVSVLINKHTKQVWWQGGENRIKK